MNSKLIKELRDKTGAGIMACKSALESSNGDIEKAMSLLQEQGIALARKKSGRSANEGIISSFNHIHQSKTSYKIISNFIDIVKENY